MKMRSLFLRPDSRGRISAGMRTISEIPNEEPAASLQPQRPWKPSHSAGGCDFPRDPLEPADRESIFWIPSLQPEAVLLSAAASARGSATAPVDLTHLPGLDLRRSDDGWHGLWRAGGTVYQFWLTEKPPDAAAAYTLTLPLDGLFELRAHAARRLLRALHARSPGRPFRAMPAQLRELHLLTFPALDA